MSSKIVAAAAPLMGARNISALYEPAPSILSLVCDLTKSLGPSASGKTMLLASTGGNKPLGTSNAFLGLNVFCKSLSQRNLSDKAVEPFAELSVAASFLKWQIVDKQYLLMQLDFANAKPRPAASEKSMILVTSSGLNKLGDTGITVGLNCYYPCGKAFQPAKLVSLDAATDADSPVVVTMLDGGSVIEIAVKIASIAGGKLNVNQLQVTDALKLQLSVISFEDAKGAASELAPVEKASNLQFQRTQSHLKFRCRVDTEVGFSSTGKSILVGSSGGHQKHDGVKFNFILFKKSDDHIEKIIRDIAVTTPKFEELGFKSQLLPLVCASMSVDAEGLADEVKEKIKTLTKKVFLETQAVSAKRPRSPDNSDTS